MRGSIIKRGNTYSIIYYIMENGVKKQKWIGGFKTKKEAEDRLNEIISQLRNNSYIPPSKTTLSEYLSMWLEEYARPNIAITTYSGYAVNINNHIIPYIGNIPLQELQPIQIQKLYNHLAKEGNSTKKCGLSPRSIQYIHMVLKQALKKAYEIQLIPKNVADMVKIPKQKKYIPNFLYEEEIPVLLEIFKNSNIYIPVLLAVGIGLRRGETLALKWANVDLENKVISITENLIPTKDGVQFSTPKTEASQREIVVPQTIIEELIQQKEKQIANKKLLGNEYIDNDLVCCYNNGKNFSPGAVSHLFADTLKANNFRHIRFHDLRHTNATLMLNADISPKVASARLGHSKVNTTLDIYSHVAKKKQEESAEKLDKFFQH